MQSNGEAYLFEDEVALEIVARRCQRLCASGDHDHIGTDHGILLKELTDRKVDTVIETAQHRRICDVGVGRRIEVEDLTHAVLRIQ